MGAAIPVNVLGIMELLEKSGHEAYIVGGCVRDLLLEREPSDFDITTDALPGEVERIFSSVRTIDYGRKHGTIAIILDGRPYEVTTYRVDGAYTDNRRPDSVTFTPDVEKDVQRRDLTVNALLMDRNGEITDYVGGIDDLMDGVIRAVGDAETRFREDALRVIRAIRFEAQLGFDTDEKTETAIHKCRWLLRNIAVERIRDEFDKILVADDAAKVLDKYRDVIAVFIPELADGFDFDQQNPFHCYDVYEHELHAVDAIPLRVPLRLAALLHDVGKPECFIVKNGWGHFYGHEKRSAEMAETILRELKYDNRTVDDVTFLIKNHGTVFNPTEKYARKKLGQMGERRLRMLIELERADVSSQAREVRIERRQMIDEFRRCVDKVVEEKQCFSKSELAIDGNDLIRVGFPQDARLGKTLDFFLDAVTEGKISNDREEMLDIAERILKKLDR